MSETIGTGDVVQILPEDESDLLGACFMVVVKVLPDRVEGYIETPNCEEPHLYCSYKIEEVSRIGRASAVLGPKDIEKLSEPLPPTLGMN